MIERKCKTAVILAAGGGTRMRSVSPDRPKCLMDLGGRPVIEWILGSLATGGVDEVIIVTGFKAGTLKRAVGDGAGRNVKIRYIYNPRWSEPNGLSLYAAKDAVGGERPFLTLMSDHLLPPRIIRKVAAAGTSKCILAVDTKISKVFDISDATKVRVTDGLPTAIGKKLRIYNAVDCGLFRFDRRIFSALEAALKKGKMTLTDGVKTLIADGDLDVLPVGDDAFWIDIDTPKAYRQALSKMEVLLSEFKSDEGNQRCSR